MPNASESCSHDCEGYCSDYWGDGGFYITYPCGDDCPYWDCYVEECTCEHHEGAE